ncbi:MAG: M1 family metallopeptidase [Bacteroidetes bacterium]|nr:M1 family metallopeptidase [Bacteroidota bacterium]
MNKLFFLIPTFFVFGWGRMQGQTPAYFQQEVAYKIEAALNDSLHQLQIEEELIYINNSPDSLHFIWFNLWPNSYLNRETALSNQFIRQNADKFYFAKAEELGGFLELDFQSNGNSLNWQFDSLHMDVAKVWLPKTLAPGDSVRLQIPCLLQIPASFSRIGHVGESYQMTQWYPKPAVYDVAGWHPMPYLNQGEFYSEFGSFDVSLSLPANYVVAATGVLQEESEYTFLKEKEKETQQEFEENIILPVSRAQTIKLDTFPASAERQKTISYKAEKVHDFAWFADKRFRVMHRSFALPSGKEVDGWIFFTLAENWLWKDALDYVERATIHYSEGVGEYPWPQVTAVQSALSAGGGMEYPMITVIGYAGSAQSLDEVITHEVGHNWFYGILGSNERTHAWMDEGLNTYFEQLYTKKYYGNLPAVNDFLPNILAGKSDISFYELAYLFYARTGLEEAADTHSDSLRSGAYYLGAYEKPNRALRQLEAWKGRAFLEQAMQQYYAEWKFRHPQPADLQNSLENSYGTSLDWLFQDFLDSRLVQDYRMAGYRRSGDSLILKVENVGEVPGPFPLAGMLGDSIVLEQWHPGFEGQREIVFPAGNYDLIELDPNQQTLELYRVNNQLKLKGRLNPFPDLGLKFLSGIDHSRKRMIYWSPTLAWNEYDKWMPGLAIHNYSLVERKVEYGLFPFYSFQTNQLNGLAAIHFNAYFRRSDMLRRIRIGGSAKRFTYDYNWQHDYHLKYDRSRLFARLDFRMPGGRLGENYMEVSGVNLQEEIPDFSEEGVYERNILNQTNFVQLRYVSSRRQAVNSWKYQVEAEYKAASNHSLGQFPFWKLSGDLEFDWSYQEDHELELRFFGSVFLMHEFRDRGVLFPWSIDLSAQAAGDYLYEDYYFGRSAQTGLLWRQQTGGEGGFFTNLPPAYRAQSGATNNFMLSLNLKGDIPKPLPAYFPFKPFFNLAYSDDARPIAAEKSFTDQLWWEAGLCLELFDGRIAFAMPFAVSSQMDALLDQNGQSRFYQRWSFTLDLSGLNLLEMRDVIAP